MRTDYHPEIDDYVQSPFTIKELQTHDEAVELTQKHPLRLRHRMRAQMHCNQLGILGEPCDFHKWVEAEQNDMQAKCRRVLGSHYKTAHPYLGQERINRLIASIHFLVHDI